MSASRPSPRFAAAPLLAALLLALAACGGGGSIDPSTGIATGGSPILGTGGSGSPQTLVGGPGDDTFLVGNGNTVVIEQPGAGNDTVRTSVSYTLPANVENLLAEEPSVAMVLIGNALDNRIVGNPFLFERIYGLDGNDDLDGGGRDGAYIEGGNGDDRLTVSVGTLVGGAGADTFVAGGRGAMTTPEAPITVRDFNPAEGDRIHIVAPQAYSSSALFASGALRFEPGTGRLVLDFDPSTTAPSSVDQVFVLEGVTAFDPAWVTVGP